PCRNGGTCLGIDESGGRCSCPVGYTGAACETGIVLCLIYSNLCYNGGTCSLVNNRHQCACRVGTTGRLCEAGEQRTSVTPSDSFGTATYSVSSGEAVDGLCARIMGDVDVDIDDTLPGANCPCRNGGTCLGIDESGGRCSCPFGYTGAACETGICSYNNPCDNGGSCSVDGSGDYNCACRPGFTGKNRETPTCSNGNPCYNGGTCGLVNNRHQCACRVGTKGKLCEAGKQPSNCPCRNGGTCLGIDESGGRCSCPVGYTGAACETGIVLCLIYSNPCYNGGTCSLVNNRHQCACLYQRDKKDCKRTKASMNKDTTQNNPCDNGGSCSVDGSGDYNCACRPGFTGKNCEIGNQISNGNPCYNGGTCDLVNNRHQCACRVGTTGKLCEAGKQRLYQLFVSM
ncbi:predicted protein, partial [Nematostella vectensis]